MLNQSLDKIHNDQDDRVSWSEILDLLNMTNATFRNDEEMEMGLKYMQRLIERHGAEWLKENRVVAMESWETILNEYRKSEEKRKLRAMKRGRKFRPDLTLKGLLKRILGWV